MRPIHAAVAIGAVLVGLGTVGCSSSAPAALPEGVTVSVYQSRSDYSAGLIDLRITNGSDAALTLTAATLASTQYRDVAHWDRGTTLASGATVDLRLDLPEPSCPTPADARPRVTIAFATAGDAASTASLVADDPIGTLEKLSKEECISFAVGVHAAITAPDHVDWEPGAHAPARLELHVAPTQAEGSATVVAVQQTNLFGLAGRGAAVLSERPVGLQVSAASRASSIRLDLVPNRCDPHAVAEDKRGTFFPLEVATSEGDTGTMYIEAPDAVRESLYEFVADWCGF